MYSLQTTLQATSLQRHGAVTFPYYNSHSACLVRCKCPDHIEIQLEINVVPSNMYLECVVCLLACGMWCRVTR